MVMTYMQPILIAFLLLNGDKKENIYNGDI